MALTGTLRADFSEFDAACEKSRGELAAFEQSANKVQGAVDRMVTTSATGLGHLDGSFVGAGLAADAFGTSVVSAGDVAQQVFQKLPSVFSEVRGGLNDVAVGAGLTVAELGLLGTAGVVVGTAITSWKLTRAAMEFLGLDDAVAHAWTTLLGFGNAADAAAGATLDVLAKATQTAGRQITDLAEAMTINAQAVRDWNETVRRANAPIDSAIQIEHWNQELDKVVKAGVLPALTRDIDSQNFSHKALAERYGISTEALGFYVKEMKDAEAESKRFRDDVDQLAKQASVEAGVRKREAAATFAEVSKIERDAHALSMGWVKELNESKAKANFEQMQDTDKSIKETEKLEREAVTLRMGFYATDREMKIQSTHQWFDDEVAKLKKSDENYQAHYGVLLDLESLKIAKIENAAAATEAAARREVAAINSVTAGYYAQVDAAVAAMVAASGGTMVSVGTRAPHLENGVWVGGTGQPTANPTGFSLPGFSLSGRAAGGPVSGGSAYLVGERGPELFTPRGNGFITPNGGGVVVTNHIYVNGTAQDVARQVAAEILRTVQQSALLS